MLEVSITTYLVIYGISLALFFLYALINLYHLFRFGFLSFTSFLATFLFLGATVLLLFITYKLGLPIDWTQTFTI
ncbi:MAG: hypothetical protein PHC97_00705 [Patescibacteria group bacterium]|nr:hypothetical protein [Patescibacteria group bacterium]